MNAKIGVAASVVLALLLVILWPSGPDDPEEAIRAVIQRTIDAAERKDLPGVMEAVSEDYRSESLSRDQIKGVLFVQLRRGAWRKVFVTDTEIDVQGERARVKLVAVLASGADVQTVEDLGETSAGRYAFDLVFADEGDEWRVIEARYERKGF